MHARMLPCGHSQVCRISPSLYRRPLGGLPELPPLAPCHVPGEAQPGPHRDQPDTCEEPTIRRSERPWVTEKEGEHWWNNIGSTRVGPVSTRSLGRRLQADALNVRYRKILREIMEQKQKMGGAMKEAFFSLTEAKYTGGENLKNTIHDNVKSANVRVKAIVENVAGVKIPRFNQQEGDGETNFDMTGLGQGGQQVQVPFPALPKWKSAVAMTPSVHGNRRTQESRSARRLSCSLSLHRFSRPLSPLTML